MSVTLEYQSNNSGGGWWLDDEDWRALETAGWVVHWIHEPDDPSHTHTKPDLGAMSGHTHAYTDEILVPATPSGKRWLGALAKSAAIVTDDVDAAVRMWAQVTKQDPAAEGCNCCGPPHGFSYTDEDGKYHYWSVEVVRTEGHWA